MNVKTCPIMEAIAKKLFGIETITDKPMKNRMINNAVEAGKDAAEQVYGGFDMMRLHRENKQLKGQNAFLSREYNKICNNSMSLEKVQEIVFSAIYSCVNSKSDLTQEYVNSFIEEWRKNNDC